MRSLIIVSAAALVLSACTATGSIDTAIKTSLPKTCALLETAHAAFIAASVSGNIKASTIAKEKAATTAFASSAPIREASRLPTRSSSLRPHTRPYLSH
ncbi:cell wall anchor protein [Ensifer adhaerens]|uniref:cell wall anchor protein n=1 Tax=Ensifer adhaerens TaxID=106592 RepID=UPI000DC33809|nr:cell wall anchor protein [Ensifer adhaerens]RAR99698.1 hypothetical protein DEU52_14626 [Ensifer adhaerens]